MIVQHPCDLLFVSSQGSAEDLVKAATGSPGWTEGAGEEDQQTKTTTDLNQVRPGLASFFEATRSGTRDFLLSFS